MGGDWFDVIPLPRARVALVVGDVVGHGLHAAATMGRLRTAVRTVLSAVGRTDLRDRHGQMDFSCHACKWLSVGVPSSAKVPMPVLEGPGET
ncbi:hypothetical protein SALBM311S_06933 [Streptomyces alboniger]